MNSRRMNRLEELGRVDAEKAKTRMGKRNLKDEKKRIVRELKADGGYITKKEKPKYITKKKPEGKLLPESGSKYITRKPKYITKKKKYITKKSPAQIQDRERVGKKMGGKVKGVKEDPMRDRMKQPLKIKKKGSIRGRGPKKPGKIM